MECSCKSPGFCPVFKRDMVGRLWEICSGNWVGKPLSAAKCEAYRQELLADAGKDKKPKDMSCIHRGEVVRLAECETCAGKRQLKIYSCKIWEACHLAKPEKLPHVKSCLGCNERIAIITDMKGAEHGLES